METAVKSKKELRDLIGSTLREAVTSLNLPMPGKKIKRTIEKSTKQLASEYLTLLRKERKKARKNAKKSMADAAKMIGTKKKNGKKVEVAQVEA